MVFRRQGICLAIAPISIKIATFNHHLFWDQSELVDYDYAMVFVPAQVSTSNQGIAITVSSCMFFRFSTVVPMANWLRTLNNHSIVSLLSLMWVRASHGTSEASKVLLASVPDVFSLGFFLFSPHLLIGPSHMS